MDEFLICKESYCMKHKQKMKCQLGNLAGLQKMWGISLKREKGKNWLTVRLGR